MNFITEKARQALMHRRDSLQAMLGDHGARSAGVREGWADGSAAREAHLVVLPPAGAPEQQELAEVVAALERIDSGQFGRCETCGGAIGRQRLRAIPEARLCISCSSTQPR